MVNVVLADDHKILLDVMVKVLEWRGITVRGTADSLAGAVEKVRATKPDVCVLDRHFADGDGLDEIHALTAYGDGTKVLILTADHDPGGIRRALLAGATGYLHKSGSVDQLAAAIRAAAAGDLAIDAVPFQPIRPAGRAADVHRLARYLTDRERECLALLVNGTGTAEMAANWGVSTTTVRTHVQSLLTKLGVHSRLEAASLAVHHALVATGVENEWPSVSARRDRVC